MLSALEQLKNVTVVVADTGNSALVRQYQPQDCTTNPSLVLSVIESGGSAELLTSEVEKARAKGLDAAALCDTLTVAIGGSLAELVPGRVSTEVDAHHSFSVDASIRRAYDIIEDYARRGIGKDRILIKLAASWEGIKAAEKLERDGINCNLTLLFSMAQAMACADAGVFLISPFVGRITDWYKRSESVEMYPPEKDPGVLSVREIFNHYKSNGIGTIVMGASFRSTGQIKALAGCDRLTISPDLLQALATDFDNVPRQLEANGIQGKAREALDETDFRWLMNESAMATDLLSDGIRRFDKDQKKLLTRLSGLL